MKIKFLRGASIKNGRLKEKNTNRGEGVGREEANLGGGIKKKEQGWKKNPSASFFTEDRVNLQRRDACAEVKTWL